MDFFFFLMMTVTAYARWVCNNDLKTSWRRPKKEGSRLFNNNKLRWKLFRGAWCFVVHTGLFPARSSRVFWGFDMSVTAAGRGRLCFLSVLFLRLLVKAVKSDCWMTRGNILAKLESWCFSTLYCKLECTAWFCNLIRQLQLRNNYGDCLFC